MAENRYRNARRHFYAGALRRRWDDEPRHAAHDPGIRHDDTQEREQWERWRPGDQEGRWPAGGHAMRDQVPDEMPERAKQGRSTEFYRDRHRRDDATGWVDAPRREVGAAHEVTAGEAPGSRWPLIRPGAYEGQSTYAGLPSEEEALESERYRHRYPENDRNDRERNAGLFAETASRGGFRAAVLCVTGRAPKGYRRSDERIREDICERIMARGDIDAGEVSIDVASGRVTLEGAVEERWMKYAIEDIADRCHGVEDIDNRVRVVRSAGRERPPGLASGSAGNAASGSGSTATGVVTSVGTDSAGGASASSFGSGGTGSGGD